MIDQFVKRFEEQKDALRAGLSDKHPENYSSLVEMVIKALTDEDDYKNTPDPNRIHTIDDGVYQGTLLFVIASTGYQPDDYWYVKVNYGSCSGCDTLQAISEYSSEPPTEQQIDDYMTLLLHIVQGLKKMA